MRKTDSCVQEGSVAFVEKERETRAPGDDIRETVGVEVADLDVLIDSAVEVGVRGGFVETTGTVGKDDLQVDAEGYEIERLVAIQVRRCQRLEGLVAAEENTPSIVQVAASVAEED